MRAFHSFNLLLLGVATAAIFVIPAQAQTTTVAPSPTPFQPVNDFQKCFCWDSAENNFCGGSDWYKSDACKRWGAHALVWPVFALLLGAALLLFPCFFFCARCCCQCCGGTHRTNGCCCSDTSTRGTFPGYSRCSVRFARLCFLGACALAAALSVHMFTTNAKLNTDVLASVTSINNTMNNALALVTEAKAVALQLEGTPFSGFGILSEVTSVLPLVTRHVNDVDKVLKKINSAEGNKGWGRAHWGYAVPAVLLFVHLIGLFLMIGGCRRSMNVVMVLATTATFGVTMLTIPHSLFSSLVDATCNNFDTTAEAIVVGIVSTNRGCNNQAIADSAAAISTAFALEAFVAGSEFCTNLNTVCAAVGCISATCPGAAEQAIPWSNNPIAVSQQMVAATTSQTSIAQAVTSGATADIRQAATYVTNFANTFVSPVTFITNTLAPANNNCGIVRTGMLELAQNLCTKPAARSRLDTFDALGKFLVLSGIFSIFVIIRGIKRFESLCSDESQMNRDSLLNGPVMGQSIESGNELYTGDAIQVNPYGYGTSYAPVTKSV